MPPLTEPAENADHATRLNLFETQSIKGSLEEGLYLGTSTTAFEILKPYELELYARQLQSSDLGQKRFGNVPELVSGIGSLLLSLIPLELDFDNLDPALLYGVLGLAGAGLGAIDDFENKKRNETEATFNKRLCQSLGLDPEECSEVLSQQNNVLPKAGGEFLLFSFGITYIQTDALNRYFGLPSGSSWNLPVHELSSFQVEGEKSLGTTFFLEYGLALTVNKDDFVDFDNTTLKTNGLDMDSLGLFLGPVYSPKALRYANGDPLLSFGLQGGVGVYEWEGYATDSYGNNTGKFDAYGIDPLAFLWLSYAPPLPDPFRFAIKCGYRYTPIFGLHVDSSSGSFSTMSPDLKDSMGNNATFDWSGPFVNLEYFFQLFPNSGSDGTNYQP